MHKLVLQKDFAFLYLHKHIFRRISIESAVGAYSEFISPEIKQVGSYFVVRLVLADNSHSLETVAREFANYVIAEEHEVRA